MSDTKKIVYFVRHGQSEENILPIYQSPDSPLSQAGREQAGSVAERIAKIDFDVLISSPLPRTKETAEAITKITNKIPEYSELFVERVKPTRLNGKSTENEEAQKLAAEWNKSLHTSGLRAENGENFDDIIARADKALDFLKNRSEKTIVVVTHGYFLRTMMIRVMLTDSLTEDNYKNFSYRSVTENTGISVLKYVKVKDENIWRLWVYNDHAHLG